MSFYNLEPLTTSEIMSVGETIHCPQCQKPRYVMWKQWAADLTADLPRWPVLVPMEGYCRCPAKGTLGDANTKSGESLSQGECEECGGPCRWEYADRYSEEAGE